MATGTGRTTGKRNQPRAKLRPVGAVSPQPHQEEELLLQTPTQVTEGISVDIQQSPRQRLQMQVGLESPLDLQVQQETMSVPQQRRQMQVGLEPPPGLHVQGEAMLSVIPRRSLLTQTEEARPQHDLQVQLGDASEDDASYKSQQIGREHV